MRKHRISSHAKRLAQSGGEMVTKLESSQMQMSLSFIKLFSNMSVLTKLDDFLLLLNGDSLSISSEMRKTAPVSKQKTGDALDFPYRAVMSPSSNTILLFIEGKIIITNFYMYAVLFSPGRNVPKLNCYVMNKMRLITSLLELTRRK